MSNEALTQSEAERAILAIAATQTAYALNNGGGVVLGQPLVYIDDQTTAGKPGYTPLNLSIPTGFIVQGIYQDKSPAGVNTGADMFMAYNAITKQVLLGMAGTNGVGHDMPDTRSDISYVGMNQAEWLARNDQFRSDLQQLVPSSEISTLRFIVGGDSLSAVSAILVPTALVYGLPARNGQDAIGKIEGLGADQFSITNVVPLGANYAASLLGITDQVQEFAQSAEIFNFTTFNSATGYDLVTGMGGGSPGRYFVGDPTGSVYSSVAAKHQLNYSFAQYVASWGGDFTQATPIDGPPLFDHQSIAGVSSQLADIRLVENNWLSMSSAGYAGMLLSLPGETAASVEKFLVDQWGWNSALAKVAGIAVEGIVRGTSYANPAYSVGALLAGLAGGKALGSDAPVLPSFPPVEIGYVRSIFQDPNSPFVGALDKGSDKTILRYTDGSTRTYYTDGRVDLSRPDGTSVYRNVDGDGILRIGKTGVVININSEDVIDMLPYSVTRITSPGSEGASVIKDYSQLTVTTYTGNYTTGIFTPTSSAVASLNLGGAESITADATYSNLGAISFASGVSVADLVSANPGLSANMSIAPGVKVNFPVTNRINLNTNTTGSIPNQTATPDGTVSPNDDGGTLFDNGNYNYGAATGNVNADQGNAAAGWGAAADGVQPGAQQVWDGFGNTPSDPGFDPGTAYGAGQIGSYINHDAGWLLNVVPVDPLVLDLNGDGVKLTNYTDSPVLFDADNDGGSLEQTGWISAQDGIIVHDLNNDGKINNISETLSEYYNGVAGTGGVAGTKPFANGFAALKSLDSNSDNQFTSADAAWGSLRVWVDANHDGKTDAGELKTFASLGITAINLNTTAQSGEVRDGNEVLARGTFTQNGLTREAIAANFLANPAGSTITQASGGVVVATENTGGGGAITSFVSQNTVSTVAETLNAATLGVRHITGGAGNDTLTGDGQNNWLAGGLGADSLSGGAGDDVLLFDAGDTSINGGDGLDIAQVIGAEGVTLNLSQSNIEIAVGGDGNDIFIGGGRSTVFVRGGAGDDLIIGGAANDVLSGEDGADLIDGGAGNDLIRGHRGRDQLLGGEGDDVLDGGLEDDTLGGGAGNDVLIGGRGDDSLNGGDGIDVAQYSGSYADYRITRVKDSASGATVFRVVDTRTGQDGADTLTNIEKLSFSDVSRVDLTLAAPLPAKDILRVNGSGQALSRTAAHLLSKQQLLANDRDWDSDTSQLSITEVLEAKGGTVTLTAQGDVLFTPDASYTGVMSFKYKVQDAQGNYTQVTSPTGQTEAMKAAVYLQTSDLPSDPLTVEQWYLTDTNVIAAWGTAAEQAAGQGYSGKGIKIGQFEPGGPFSTGPEVFDYRHPDLAANADKAWLNTLDANGNNNTPQVFSNHATMVAGVMVAARNGEGGVGVAYNASLAGHYIQGEGLEVSQLNQEITNALAKFRNYDVVNNSWGPTSNFMLNVTPVGLLQTGMLDAVQNGRNGLGTAIVMAGGNDREHGANTNYNALTANRAVITVGSINAPGDLGTLQMGSKPFSNPGSSILVSAPGSNIDSTSRELISDNGSTFGSDYNTSQGTSFAAPIVSGIIALMLEANPGLGYRDIQTILAMSATQFTDPNGTDWTYNTAKNWNGGGMHASHDYGFGKVDARAAVRLAETWYDVSTFANEQNKTASSGTLNAAIPDGAGVLTRTLTMAAGLEVETAQVTLELNHQRWGDLIIKLISPTGTESILVNRPGKAPGSAGTDLGDASSGTLSFSFNTTHVRGEASGGIWTLQVIDAAAGNAGTLTNWKLDLYGATADSNDVYVYTNEFAATAGRTTLTDSNGGTSDIINASVVTGNSTINLNNGSTSTLAGKNLTINGDIERAYGGDGNDTLTGNALTNVLLGGRGNDTLNGGGGEDRVEGGRGNDTLTGGAARDWFVIQKDAGSVDTITDFAPSEVGEKIALIGFENVTDFSQVVATQEGANTRLSLGDGQSVLLLNLAPSQVSEQNFVFASDAASLEIYLNYAFKALAWGTPGAENQLLPNNWGDLAMYALGGNDVLGSQTTNDLIDGGDGNDTLWGDYPGSSPTPGSDWLEGGSGNDVLYGGAGADRLVGGSGNDELYGQDGDDLLIGNTGADYMEGGAGNDVLTLDGDFGTVSGASFGFYGTRVGGTGADVFKVLSSGGGSNGFIASGTQFSGANMIADFDPNQVGEKIDLTAFKWITSLSDLVISNWSINGNQLARISASNGTASVNLNLRGITSSQLNASHFVFAPATPGAVNGTAANDTLTGDAGANTINGLAGVDSMTGRTGDDTYIVDNTGDIINELPGGGYDSVQSSVSYALSDNVEALTLSGAGNLNATGNAQRNRLVGNAGDNRLDGGAEADSLIGGLGNDVYVVDDQLDTAFENAGEGTDTVEAGVSWTLGNNFENLTLTGTGSVNATGNELANVLAGNSGDNVLDGAQGADAMAGGAGDDTYYVDNAGDTVSEALDQGIDTVYTSVNLTLGSNVENAVLFGAAATLTGNGLDNTLLGNSLVNTLTGGGGNDVLDGGAGADAMAGGAGNDSYFVDNAGDTVAENAAEGIDTVIASLGYTLGANVENLILTGSANLSGAGNTLDNQIRGNSGNNTLSGGGGNDVLDGGAGADAMAGGTGDDSYHVDNALDTVSENASEGTDTVISAIGYSLGANLESLVLGGAGNNNGTGNALANLLRGNAANNTLDGAGGFDALEGGAGSDILADTSGASYYNGGDGADTLTGGAAADFLIGGDGNDTITSGNGPDVIAFNVGDGRDTVNPGGGMDDTLSLGGAGLSYANLSLQKNGNDLVLNVSADDKLTFSNWYASTANKNVLNLQLVAEAMSAFDAGSSDPLLNKKIQTFDFQGLVSAFDTALALSPGLSSWALSNGLTQFHLAGSDSEALGGDLAYYYGRDGAVAGMGFDKAQDVVTASQFGAQAQALNALNTLQVGVLRLG